MLQAQYTAFAVGVVALLVMCVMFVGVGSLSFVSRTTGAARSLNTLLRGNMYQQLPLAENPVGPTSAEHPVDPTSPENPVDPTSAEHPVDPTSRKRLFSPRTIFSTVSVPDPLPTLMFPDRVEEATHCFVPGKTPASAEDLWIVRHFEGCPKHAVTSFPGRVLRFNAETTDTQLTAKEVQSGRVWYVGPYARPGLRPDVYPHGRIFHAALWLPTLLLDPALRMGVGFDKLSASHFNNTGQRFLVYASRNCKQFRQHAFDLIYAARKQAGLALPAALGKCVGSHGDAYVSAPTFRHHRTNSLAFRQYRFVLCMENRAYPGYITEKIVNAFAAGAVPVWFGTTDVFDVFNKAAFVFWDPSNPQPALDEIMNLDRDPVAYQHKRQQPLLANGTQTVVDHFSLAERHGGGHIRSLILAAMNTVPHTWSKEPPIHRAKRSGLQAWLEYESGSTAGGS